MKKAIIALAACALLTQSCNKDYEKVSQVQKVSYPTITFSGQPYYSINTGGDVPAIVASAYDSTLKESDSVSIVGTEAIDNTTPGLYIISAKATNKYGFYTNSNVYIAVTDVSSNVHLEGVYERVGVPGSTTNVERLARGLYRSDNLFGGTTALASLLFVHVNDTTIIVPAQETELGTLTTADNKLKLAVGDTTFSYSIQGGNLTTNKAIRSFKKK